MRVWPVFGARLLRSLWDFRSWIPGEKLHSLDYSLGLFRAVRLEVIFHWGFWAMWTPRGIPMWHSSIYSRIFWFDMWDRSPVSSSAFFVSTVRLSELHLYILSLTPKGDFTPLWVMTLYFYLYILWDIILSLGKGALAHFGPFLALYVFYVMLSCIESCHEGGTSCLH